jgi:hypothetical protein
MTITREVNDLISHITDCAQMSDAERLKMDIADLASEAKVTFHTEEDRARFLELLDCESFQAVTPGKGNKYLFVSILF